MLLSENAMQLYGIRLIVIEVTLFVIEIKISNANLSKRKSSIALIFQCKYVYIYIIDCVSIKYIEGYISVKGVKSMFKAKTS